MKEPDRRRHPLLTLDRALLVGAFSIGVWVATGDARNADLKTRAEATEKRLTVNEQRLADHDKADALIQRELEYISENLEKLANATAKLASRASGGGEN